jgi:hypothetical protein
MLIAMGASRKRAHHREPRRPMCAPTARIPAVAANESWNETSHGAPGSARIGTRAARASVFHQSWRRSRSLAPASTVAMRSARRREIGIEAIAPNAQRRTTVTAGIARLGISIERGAERMQ